MIRTAQWELKRFVAEATEELVPDRSIRRLVVPGATVFSLVPVAVPIRGAIVVLWFQVGQFREVAATIRTRRIRDRRAIGHRVRTILRRIVRTAIRRRTRRTRQTAIRRTDRIQGRGPDRDRGPVPGQHLRGLGRTGGGWTGRLPVVVGGSLSRVVGTRKDFYVVGQANTCAVTFRDRPIVTN